MIPAVLDVIIAVSIQFADSQPEKPETVHKVRKAHRVLPAEAKPLSPKVSSVKWEELEWSGEEEENIRSYIKGSDTPYTGKSYRLYPNGQREHETNWKDGQRHGLNVYWRESGELWFKGNYKNDKREGLWVEWYDEKQKYEERHYKNGDRHGLWACYHYNGKKMSESPFKDDEYHGVFSTWHDNGQKKHEEIFKDNKYIKGSTKYWNKKGELVESWEEVNKE